MLHCYWTLAAVAIFMITQLFNRSQPVKAAVTFT